jgi:hypothetical protein
MSDTQFNYHIQNANNGCIGLAVSYATGYVGIGTCSPSFTLDVAAPSNNQGIRINSVQAAALYLYSTFNDAGNRNWGIYNNSNVFGDFDIRQSNAKDGNMTVGANGTSRLYIKNDGNVGIGTLSPTAKLHVNGSSQFDDGLNFASRGKMSWGGSPARLILTSCGSYNLALGTDDFVDRMTIQASTGNVGVGTSCPATKLHIYGSHVGGRGILELQSADDALIALRKSSGASGMRFQDFNGTDRWFMGEFNDCNIHIMDCFTSAKSRLTITRPGNVGINTCNPETTLHMTADSPYVYMDDTSTGSNRKRIKLVAGDVGVIQSFSIAFSCTNNTCQVDAMFVTENASVGINTACPGAYKLNVNGAFYAAGSSKEYKTSICEYNTDSCMFMKLKPVTYDYKEEWKHLGKQLKSGTQIGLIAEDTAEVFPELAVLKEEENEQVVRNVDYEKLSIVLLAEVQKLRQEVDQLKNK